jgi:Tol biopolymer transport system component
MLRYFRPAILLILGAACLAVPVSAAEKPGKLEPTDLFNIEFPFDPQISPDGKRFVYARRFCDIMSDRRCSNLWIINSDGTGHRALTTGNSNDFSARWSPDGTRIMYISTRDGIPQIYLRWMDTGQTTRLTNLTTAPSGTDWSPDGKSIVFMAFVPGAPRQIGSFPAPPAGAKWADPAMVIDKLTYRWDRIGYLKPGSWQIFVISADGGSPRQVTTGHIAYGFEDISGGSPKWTPDGKYLIISANCRPDAEYEPFDTELYQICVADGSFKALTDRRGPDSGPAVSPDGSLIAYTGYDDKYQIYQVTRLYIVNRDGTGSRLISGGLDRDVVSPQWAADGSGVFFLYDDQGDTKLGFYSADGKFKEVAKNIGTLGFTESLHSSIGSFSISKTGEYAVPYTRPDVPAEIAVGQVDRHNAVPITQMNRELLANKDLGQVEETPTMVMTGQEDYRTPMSESEQYYQALKLLKVEAVLVRVPGEGHGVLGRPSHHRAKVLFISNWFDQHRIVR